MTLNNQTVKNDEKCRNFQASDIAHSQKDKWIISPSQVFIVFHRLMFYLFFPHLKTKTKKKLFITKIHIWGIRGHAALVHPTFHVI